MQYPLSLRRRCCALATCLVLLAPPSLALATLSTSPVALHGVASLAARAERNLRAGELRPLDERALDFYRKSAALAAEALKADSNLAKAHFLYFAAQGRILLEQGKVRNAFALKRLRKHLDRSLQLDPDYPDALAAKGAVLMELPPALGGDKTEGEQLLRLAVRESPVGPITRLLLAKALLANGKVSEALHQLDLAGGYAVRQRRYRALRDVEELTRAVNGGAAKAERR
jgi:predicted Zn-dependent protease